MTTAVYTTKSGQGSPSTVSLMNVAQQQRRYYEDPYTLPSRIEDANVPLLSLLTRSFTFTNTHGEAGIHSVRVAGSGGATARAASEVTRFSPYFTAGRNVWPPLPPAPESAYNTVKPERVDRKWPGENPPNHRESGNRKHDADSPPSPLRVETGWNKRPAREGRKATLATSFTSSSSSSLSSSSGNQEERAAQLNTTTWLDDVLTEYVQQRQRAGKETHAKPHRHVKGKVAQTDRSSQLRERTSPIAFRDDSTSAQSDESAPKRVKPVPCDPTYGARIDELHRRFQEQIEVNRTLTRALRDVDMVARATHTFQTHERTQLAAAMVAERASEQLAAVQQISRPPLPPPIRAAVEKPKATVVPPPPASDVYTIVMEDGRILTRTPLGSSSTEQQSRATAAVSTASPSSRSYDARKEIPTKTILSQGSKNTKVVPQKQNQRDGKRKDGSRQGAIPEPPSRAPVQIVRPNALLSGEGVPYVRVRYVPKPAEETEGTALKQKRSLGSSAVEHSAVYSESFEKESDAVASEMSTITRKSKKTSSIVSISDRRSSRDTSPASTHTSTTTTSSSVELEAHNESRDETESVSADEFESPTTTTDGSSSDVSGPSSMHENRTTSVQSYSTDSFESTSTGKSTDSTPTSTAESTNDTLGRGRRLDEPMKLTPDEISRMLSMLRRTCNRADKVIGLWEKHQGLVQESSPAPDADTPTATAPIESQPALPRVRDVPETTAAPDATIVSPTQDTVPETAELEEVPPKRTAVTNDKRIARAPQNSKDLQEVAQLQNLVARLRNNVLMLATARRNRKAKVRLLRDVKVLAKVRKELMQETALRLTDFLDKQHPIAVSAETIDQRAKRLTRLLSGKPMSHSSDDEDTSETDSSAPVSEFSEKLRAASRKRGASKKTKKKSGKGKTQKTRKAKRNRSLSYSSDGSEIGFDVHQESSSGAGDSTDEIEVSFDVATTSRSSRSGASSTISVDFDNGSGGSSKNHGDDDDVSVEFDVSGGSGSGRDGEDTSLSLSASFSNDSDQSDSKSTESLSLDVDESVRGDKSKEQAHQSDGDDSVSLDQWDTDPRMALTRQEERIADAFADSVGGEANEDDVDDFLLRGSAASTSVASLEVSVAAGAASADSGAPSLSVHGSTSSSVPLDVDGGEDDTESSTMPSSPEDKGEKEEEYSSAFSEPADSGSSDNDSYWRNFAAHQEKLKRDEEKERENQRRQALTMQRKLLREYLNAASAQKDAVAVRKASSEHLNDSGADAAPMTNEKVDALLKPADVKTATAEPVSSGYPSRTSSNTSDSEEVTTTDTSDDTESSDGSDAREALRLDMEETEERRSAALTRVHLDTFTQLYDPTAERTSTSDDDDDDDTDDGRSSVVVGETPAVQKASDESGSKKSAKQRTSHSSSSATEQSTVATDTADRSRSSDFSFDLTDDIEGSTKKRKSKQRVSGKRRALDLPDELSPPSLGLSTEQAADFHGAGVLLPLENPHPHDQHHRKTWKDLPAEVLPQRPSTIPASGLEVPPLILRTAEQDEALAKNGGEQARGQVSSVSYGGGAAALNAYSVDQVDATQRDSVNASQRTPAFLPQPPSSFLYAMNPTGDDPFSEMEVWKARQKQIIAQLSNELYGAQSTESLPSPTVPTVESAIRSSDTQEKQQSAILEAEAAHAHHWGMLESLLHTRFRQGTVDESAVVRKTDTTANIPSSLSASSIHSYSQASYDSDAESIEEQED